MCVRRDLSHEKETLGAFVVVLLSCCRGVFCVSVTVFGSVPSPAALLSIEKRKFN